MAWAIFLAQLLTVGADHVLDVRAYQVRENGMRQVEIIGPDEEQIKMSIHAFAAVVIRDGRVQAFSVIVRDRFGDVIAGDVGQIFLQREMPGHENEVVVPNAEVAHGA